MPAGSDPVLATPVYTSWLRAMSAFGMVNPSPPVSLRVAAFRPPRYWEFRFLTSTSRLTASGALPFGADRDSAVPREVTRDAADDSWLDRPRVSALPFEAPARPAPPKITASARAAAVTGRTAAGRSARSRAGTVLSLTWPAPFRWTTGS